MPTIAKSVAAALLAVGVLTGAVAPAQAAPQTQSSYQQDDTAWD